MTRGVETTHRDDGNTDGANLTYIYLIYKPPAYLLTSQTMFNIEKDTHFLLMYKSSRENLTSGCSVPFKTFSHFPQNPSLSFPNTKPFNLDPFKTAEHRVADKMPAFAMAPEPVPSTKPTINLFSQRTSASTTTPLDESDVLNIIFGILATLTALLSVVVAYQQLVAARRNSNSQPVELEATVPYASLTVASDEG